MSRCKFAKIGRVCWAAALIIGFLWVCGAAGAQEKTDLHAVHHHAATEDSSFFSSLLKVYTPRQQCMDYEAPVIWLHLISDFVIGAAYFSIPIALMVFVQKRRDLDFNWAFYLFAAFILACGTTHFFSVWAIWQPVYKLDGLVKLFTAAVSAATAVALWPLIPRALAIPSRAGLEAAVEQRTIALQQTNLALEQALASEKYTREALQESESRFRLTFENAAVGIAHVALDGRWLLLNHTICSITGYPREELLQKTFSDITHPDDLEPDLQQVKLLLSGAIPSYSIEKRYIRKDARPVWVRLSASLVRHASGDPHYFIAVIEDIDARKHAEDEKARLAAIVESSEDSIVSQDLTETITTWNGGAERIFGFSAAEAIGQPVSIIIPPESRAEEAASLEVVYEGGTVRQREGVRCRKDGSLLHVSLTASPVRDQAGKVVGISRIARDITENRRAEQALRESEDKFRALAENIPQLAWMTDSNGWIFWYNKRWYDYTGTTLEEMQGWGWKHVHHPDYTEPVTAKWLKALQAGELWEDTFPIKGKDGQYRWFLSRAFPIRGEHGEIKIWFGTNTDITDLRESTQALEKVQHELRRHNQTLESTVQERTAQLREAVAELESYSYSIAHDMRAPLRAMTGFANLLVQEYGPTLDPEAQTYLQRIASAAQRLDHLIQDVLNYSKVLKGDIRLDTFEPQLLLNQIIDTYPNLHASHADVLIEGPLPAVKGNLAALTQIFSNLLGNAVKFVAPGVRPRIRIRAESIPPKTSSEANSGPSAVPRVRLWFEDNGIGISPESTARLFQLFQRLHAPEQFEGTGLGLAIVRKAVERMGGTVGVESELGKGSRFWIELPAAS